MKIFTSKIYKIFLFLLIFMTHSNFVLARRPDTWLPTLPEENPGQSGSTTLRPPADDAWGKIDSQLNLPFTNLDGVEGYIFGILQTLIGLGGIVAAAMIVYGAYVLILSSGEPDNIAKGQRIITNAVIGLIVAAISFMIINFVIGIV